MRINEILTEKWSQKYKNSINCSHPKGFSQRAHCAGKRKHNESHEVMEMTCPDCGRCETHGNINEIAKGQKDANGFTRCWPNHHAEGTKRGKNGGQVRKCVPNESVTEEDRLNEFSPNRDSGEDYMPQLVLVSAGIQAENHGKRSYNYHFDVIDEDGEQMGDCMVNSARGILEGDIFLNGKVKYFAYKMTDRYRPFVQQAHDLINDHENQGVSEDNLKEFAPPEDHNWDDGELDDDPVGRAAYRAAMTIKAWQMDRATAIKTLASYPQLIAQLKTLEPAILTDKTEFQELLDWAVTQSRMSDASMMDISNDIRNTEGPEDDDELDEEFDLVESIIEGLADHNSVDAEVIWEDLESLTDDELYVFAVTQQTITEDWQKVNKRDHTSGMSQKAVNAYRREHPGSKLKTAVTTKPSKLKRGSKASKRRKSYCSRSRGQMKMHNISCAKTPDKAICKARRRWNC